MSSNKIISNKQRKFNWKFMLQLMVVTIIVVGLETLSYFGIAIWFGKLFGVDHTLDLQLLVDQKMPWCTGLLIVYIPWPFMWFVVIPAVIYFASGKHAYYQYVINSLLMYLAGIIIYAIIPTTCSPSQFINGPYGNLPSNALFYNYITKLANNPDNIWGSCPSYHNYWAALFIFFAFKKDVKWYFRYPMIIVGLLISLSTLMLHQHNLVDVIVTYTMVFLFILVEKQFALAKRFSLLTDKLFRVKYKTVS